MSARVILVDGYSVLHFWPQLRKLAGRSLQQQRDVLITVLRQFGDATAAHVIVVFDGYAAKRKPEESEPTPGIEVLFSETGRTADDVIERIVGAAEHPRHITVVTSDNLERRTVESLGATSVSCDLFEQEVTSALGELGRLVRQHSRAGRLNSLRHHFEG